MPDFDEDVRLDTSQVEDRRGVGRRGAVAGVGGGAGLIVLIITLLLGGNPLPSDPGVRPPVGQEGGCPAAGGNLTQNCRVGADADRQEDCRIVGYVNSIQSYWTAEFKRRNARY